MIIDDSLRDRLRQKLIEKHGPEQDVRIERGIKQAADLWTEADGSPEDFADFCDKYFIGDYKQLDDTFDKLDRSFEAIDGHFNAMEQTLREPLDLDLGPISPVDELLSQFNPSAHLNDDLFKLRLAFTILLNFPRYTTAEKEVLSDAWSERDWAMARMGDFFPSRIPALLQQEMSKVMAAANAYVYEYNIYMGNLRDRNNEQLFPEDLRLISHWGLRDELKSRYGKEDGLDRQRMIYRVMEKIITQDIPGDIINNPDLIWNVYEDKVYHDKQLQVSTPEPNTRYRHILDVFHVMRKMDDYYPEFPTYIKRKFDLQREITEDKIEGLFVELLSSPEMSRTAELIKKRLGRDLYAFDIWYDGFKPRSDVSTEELSRKTTEKYPDVGAFQHDIKNILMSLGFSPEQADFIAPRITVDRSRGPGHAWGAEMKEAKAHLRTRLSDNGMDYKGYNIALHELGHTVEQTLSLHKVDYHTMQGVPIAACTEAFAFIFQHHDLELLGVRKEDKQAAHLKSLDIFWGTAEIMAMSLVDMKMWNWLYENPDATPESLKKAMLDIAQDTWNRYYADIIGSRDEIILAIYSHMINYPLYLADYPLGHIIQFQIEKFLEGKNLGVEMERICSAGNLLPSLWMKHAVGSDIAVDSLIKAAGEALETIE